MKKIILSLATLAALSTTAFASWRDVTTVTGDQDAPPFTVNSTSNTVPLAAIKMAAPTGTLTAYQRMLLNAQDPGSSRR